MTIQALGYLGLEVSDLPAWQNFLSGFTGAQWPASEDNGTVHVRIDDHASRLQISQGAADDLVYVAWDAGSPASLAETQAALEAAGVAVETGSAEDAAKRKVAALIRFIDPSGMQNEVYYGAERAFDAPFVPGKPHGGFVTGDQGLGHFILNVPDVAAARAFYEGVLGFSLSDYIRFQPFPGFDVDITFLRCNGRHHSLALAHFPFAKRMQHFMLQYENLDDVGRAYDVAQAEEMPITLTLGRHSNDHMVSFYLRTPSVFEVELGWGAIDVPNEGWAVQLHKTQSVWGHKPGPAMPPPPGVPGEPKP